MIMKCLKGFEFVNELAKTCPKGFLEGRGAENFGTENNNIAMWYSQNLVSNYQKTESLGLTDRYGYAYSPVLENGREGWANFTGDWNMAIAYAGKPSSAGISSRRPDSSRSASAQREVESAMIATW